MQVRLELAELVAQVFASVSATVGNFCEAAAVEQPLHYHLAFIENQVLRVFVCVCVCTGVE
jgi:hypothetical protein